MHKEQIHCKLLMLNPNTDIFEKRQHRMRSLNVTPTFVLGRHCVWTECRSFADEPFNTVIVLVKLMTDDSSCTICLDDKRKI